MHSPPLDFLSTWGMKRSEILEKIAGIVYLKITSVHVLRAWGDT